MPRLFSFLVQSLLLAGYIQAWFPKPGSSSSGNTFSRPQRLPTVLLAETTRGGESPENSPRETPDFHHEEPRHVLLLMDAFCPYHGQYLGDRAAEQYGVHVIPVFSNYLCDFLLLQVDDNDEHSDEERDQLQALRVPSPDETEKWEALLQALRHISNGEKRVAVYCESDSGLSDAETLRLCLQEAGISNVLVDDPVQLEARRHKYQMQEKAGSGSFQQAFCTSIEEAQEFAVPFFKSNNPIVIKPHRGVASEAVSLAATNDDITAAWKEITSSSVFGERGQHESVVAQEFVKGTEYAVDIVSCGPGKHKVAAAWRYDKRRTSDGAPFVYYQTKLVSRQDDPVVAGVCQCARQALDRLGIYWGLTHTEVIHSDAKGPVLVEVNCRQHNMDVAPITMSCMGTNAIDMLLEALFGNADNLEDDPPATHAQGCMVHLVNSAEGKVVNVCHLEEMAKMESVLAFKIYDHFQDGNVVSPTTDIRTDAGWVQMVHNETAVLQRDYEQIVKWMPTMFEVENVGDE